MGYSERKKFHAGQSLIEILIGIAITALLAGTAATTIVLTTRTNQQSAASKNASSLGQELIDKTKSVAEGSWNAIYSLSDKTASSTYYITGTSTLSVATGTESVVIGGETFTRWFSVENVNRDSNGDIVESGGTEDPSTQKITAWVQLPFRGGTVEINIVEYITRWSKDRVTVFTDWSGSSGVNGPITTPDLNYFATSGDIDVSTSGQLSLIQAASSGSLISSTFDTGFSNGVKINSVMWQGTEGTGVSSVKFQIASSNCSSGESNFPTCTQDGWGVPATGDGAFMGSDGSSASFYEPSAPNFPYAIPTNQHNNKRYYRYKVFLEKEISETSPVVDDIVINWSP